MTDEQRASLLAKTDRYLDWVALLASLPTPRRMRAIFSRYPRGVSQCSLYAWMGLPQRQCRNLLERWERHGLIEREYGVREKADYVARRALGQRVVRVEVEYVLWRSKDGPDRRVSASGATGAAGGPAGKATDG